MVKLMLTLLAVMLAAGTAFAGEKERGLAYEHDPIGLDMFNQPMIKPQEQPITYPTGTVPRRGIEPAMDRATAEAELQNPIPLTKESVQTGRYEFAKNCAACHGMDAKGTTPVAEKLAAAGAPLWDITLTIPSRGDGYIYGTIRNGGINMPGYKGQTSPEGRWHIVNYLRSLTSNE